MITFYHDIEQNFDSHADVQACRMMVSEFLKLEKKYNISSTYNVVGKLFVEQPDLIDMILNEGQEIAYHSYNHQRDWNPEYFSNEIALCQKVSPVPKGYRSPRSQINQTAVKTLWDEGFFWSAERDQHSEPYFIYKGLIRLPIAADDWPLYEGKVTADEWVQKFIKLIQNNSYVAFGLHDFVATINPEEILYAWDKILQNAVAQNALILNFSEAADLFRRVTDLRNLASNNHANKNIFLKEIDVLINKEIKKFDNPKISILCHEFGTSPSTYREIIDKYNCSVIESSSYNNRCTNETTDDNIELNSIDLLICTDIFGYNFLQDCIADEIKRICKIGASIILVLPKSNEKNSFEFKQNLTNYHFTHAQIKRWFHQIGSGYLAVLDYNPDSNTHFIFLGKVQNKNQSFQNKRIIPLSKANFNFPNPVIEGYKINLENTGLKLIKPIKEIVKKVLFHS
jgi:peptidoglycan/xylan/chitin deacetylase (PgdA/CDA1 family)